MKYVLCKWSTGLPPSIPKVAYLSFEQYSSIYNLPVFCQLLLVFAIQFVPVAIAFSPPPLASVHQRRVWSNSKKEACLITSKMSLCQEQSPLKQLVQTLGNHSSRALKSLGMYWVRMECYYWTAPQVVQNVCMITSLIKKWFNHFTLEMIVLDYN